MERVKLVLVGDGACGKTCLLIRYTSKHFPGEYVPTVFDNYSSNIMLEQRPVTIGLWDTAGQTDYDRLRPLSYPQTDIFLLCFGGDPFGVSSKEMLTNVKDKWLPEVRQHCPSASLFLMGLKTDLRCKAGNNSEVSYVEGARFAKNHGLLKYFELSALTDSQETIDNIFLEILRMHLDKPLTRVTKGRGLPICDLSCIDTVRPKSAKLQTMTIPALVTYSKENSEEMKNVLKVIGDKFESGSEEDLQSIKVCI